jgi:hypothetical protein
MITVYSGLPGSGKSTQLARVGLNLLKRNVKLYSKTGIKRKVCSNIKFSSLIEKEFKSFIHYWSDINEIVTFESADILIDEIAIYFDAQSWADTSMDVKRFLRLHRHYEVDIYGVAQDFDTVDISFRRLTRHLWHIHRIFGTAEPSKMRPASKRPFVISLFRLVDKKDYEKKKEEYTYISSEWNLFTKRDFDVFNTHEKFTVNTTLPLRHIVKACSECGKTLVLHR